jgi:hypothetical protein
VTMASIRIVTRQNKLRAESVRTQFLPWAAIVRVEELIFFAFLSRSLAPGSSLLFNVARYHPCINKDRRICELLLGNADSSDLRQAGLAKFRKSEALLLKKAKIRQLVPQF